MRCPKELLVCSLIILSGLRIAAQDAQGTVAIPTATQWMLDAAGATQRNSIRSVFLLVCPVTQKKGTSFLLATGTVVTNAHVVKGCTEHDLVAYTPLGEKLSFSKLVRDEQRDLALLRPTRKLTGGLRLRTGADPALGKEVSTWGFPLIYNGPSPLLSVGYVAGYNAVKVGGRTVKHIVVNGAFNPGNSGGPVFLSGDNEVAGIVVWKQVLFSTGVPTIIEGFKHARGVQIGGNFSVTLPDGSSKGVSDQEAIGAVLEEFYDTAQVVIGEAISASELRDFLKESEKALD
jgi:S1-C subfamily serine protease